MVKWSAELKLQIYILRWDFFDTNLLLFDTNFMRDPNISFFTQMIKIDIIRYILTKINSRTSRINVKTSNKCKNIENQLKKVGNQFKNFFQIHSRHFRIDSRRF